MALASTLGWHYLDSGALYRAFGLFVRQQSISVDHYAELAQAAKELDFHTQFSPSGGYRVLLSGVDVSDEIRTEECAALASHLAKIPEVRVAMLSRQRQMAKLPGLVAEGRDMGTVVFPAANLKIYLTASSEKRAERRYNQLKEKGLDVTLPALLKELADRDHQDRNRKTAPLKPATDAIIVDSTGVTIEGVFDRVRALVTERLSI